MIYLFAELYVFLSTLALNNFFSRVLEISCWLSYVYFRFYFIHDLKDLKEEEKIPKDLESSGVSSLVSILCSAVIWILCCNVLLLRKYTSGELASTCLFPLVLNPFCWSSSSKLLSSSSWSFFRSYSRLRSCTKK